MKFRALNANEIDVRVGTQSEEGVSLLLYKDARVDMNILDETVGAENWQRRHYECKGNLFCSVGIYDSIKQEWIWKDDCGTESFTEKEKGEASDSFKRSCTNHGIGRELYTAPFLWVSADKIMFKTNAKGEIMKGANGKPIIKSKFRVKDIEIEDGVITRICICDQKGNDLIQEGYERQKKQPEAPKCEKCQKTIVSAPSKVKGEEGKFIPASQVVATSKEITSKAGLGEHVYCPECLKKVIAEVKNGK